MMDNLENLEQNENVEMEIKEEVLKVPYVPASQNCEPLNSTMPIGFATEQIYFNNKLRSMFDVDEYVREKLQYSSVEELCKAFASEQIDGIATAIYNWETTKKAIIISDQTGLGKGRMIAGLIRYSILTLKKFPVFFTEKVNLFSDMYRDLFDIGFEANIPIAIKTKPTILDDEDITDELILSEIKKDIDKEDLRVSYVFPTYDFELSDILKEENSDILNDIIELYRDDIAENGIVIGDEYTYLTEENITERKIKNIIKKDIEEHNFLRFYDGELTQDQIDKLFEPRYEKILKDVIKSYISYFSIQAREQEAKKEGRFRIYPIAPFKLQIINKAGDLLYDIDGGRLKQLLQSQQIEPKYQQFSLLCLLYSTISKGYYDRKTGEKTPKARFIEKLCEDRVVLLDESHNAAGSKQTQNKKTGKLEPSKTFQNLSFILRRAPYVTYISATWSKRSDNIPIYALKTAIQDSKLSNPQVVGAFDIGGLALQEVVSSALVKDGQLIRRDKDVKAEVFIPQLAESDNTALYQIDRIERMANIWSMMMEQYKGIIDIFKIERKNFTLEGEGFSDDEIQKLGYDVCLKIVQSRYTLSSNLRTQLSRFFEYFIVSLKVNQTVQYALDELKQGRKVVIAISNTFASQFDNIKKDYAQNIPFNYGDFIPNDLVEMFKGQTAKLLGFNYKGVRILDDGSKQPLNIKINLFDKTIDDYGKPNFINLIASFQRTKEFLQQLFENFEDIGTSLSPIDVIISKISQNGYKIDEMTGRSKQLIFQSTDDSDQNNRKIDYTKGVFAKREKSDKMKLVNKFNSNELDALILNVSGATGLSLHALETMVQGKVVPPVNIRTPEPPKNLLPKNEVKARTMIILQMEKDISKEMQKLGRINRNGQAFIPRYIYVNSIIPSEARFNAMAQKKLKSLMSITAGSQDYGQDIFNYDDYISEYGVDAWNITRQLLNYPEADWSVKSSDELKTKSNLLYFLRYDEQKAFYNTLKTQLDRQIQIAIQNNTYRTKLDYENYLAESQSIYPFIITSSNTPTIFGSHVFAELIKIQKNFDVISVPELDKFFDSEYNRKVYDNANMTFTQSSLSQYQKEQVNRINNLLKLVNEKADTIIGEANEGIKTLQSQLKAANDELKDFPDIEEIVLLDTKISELERKKSELGVKMVDKLGQGVTAEEETREIQSIGSELSKLNEEKNRKSKGVSKEELKIKKRDLESRVRYATNGIDERNKIIERSNSEKNEQKQIADLFIEYISNIGNVFEISYFEEIKKIVGQDDNYDDIVEYSYILKSTENVVMTRVEFNFSRLDFALSEIGVYYATSTHRDMFYLSSAYKQINTLKGQEHTTRVKLSNVNYKDFWGNYIQSIDTRYYQNEIVFSGDLLKAVAFQSFLKLTGKLVKYTTSDNRLKTSFLLEKESKNQMQEIIDKIATKGEYSLLYAMSIDNTKNIISSMIAKRVFDLLGGIRFDLDVFAYSGGSENKADFIACATQIFYDESRIFLVFYPNIVLFDKINTYLNSQNITLDVFADDNKTKNLIQGISNFVYENFDDVRLIFSSDSTKPLNIFGNICNNIDSITKLSKYNDDSSDILMKDSDNSSKILISISNIGDTDKIGDIPKYVYSESAYTNNIFHFNRRNDYGLNIGVYILESELLREREIEKSSEKEYFSMKYNISFTALAFTKLITYLDKLNVQMIGGTSSNTLDYCKNPYVFNIESSATGTIEQVAMPDNVGDKKNLAIENIINDFVKFYLNN